jgi:YaiO family outer membrane protein
MRRERTHRDIGVRRFARTGRVFAGAIALCVSAASPAKAQSTLAGGLPGSWVEANVFGQSVTNDYGHWSGAYLRFASPSGNNTWYADALALNAFGESGGQVGAAHRHDWSPRVFHMLGANVGSGASILPRVRADASLGVRLGERKMWQAVGGLSYVKSVTELYDFAPFASLAWYGPHSLMVEVGGRYNTSNPGDIKSHRILATSVWTPKPTRTFSFRFTGGTEGYQTVSVGTLITKFASQDVALAWREMVSTSFAIHVQVDGYQNPYYTRSGVTLGVARYW